MTKYRVLLSETAMRQLQNLPANLQKRIKRSLAGLEEDSFRSRAKVHIKKLMGPKKIYYRLRIGDYRVVYVIEDKNVKVAKIFHRSAGYDWIE